MRYLLPIAIGSLVLGCSMPQAHDPNLDKHPKIPYQEEAISQVPLSDGSLWQDRLMVADLRARRLNDLLTVRITESTSAVAKADVSTSRNGGNTLNAPSLFSQLAKVGIGGGASTAPSTSTVSTYKGAGSTDRSATFTATITARVVKVLGNGNLVFEGYRDIQLNNETQRLYIAGMVEPSRLDTNNSIASTQVAELKLGYGGKGVVDETMKPGYISRLLAYIWPF
jgi:flagellar L-ring protein precursor FlgH